MPYTMRGTILPGITVPIHSHADAEIYVAVSGTVEALAETTESMAWIEISPGDVFHVPGIAKHAFRNHSRDPSVMFIISTEKIARFFRSVGKLVDRTDLWSEPPTAEAIRNFLATAEELDIGTLRQKRMHGRHSVGTVVIGLAFLARSSAYGIGRRAKCQLYESLVMPALQRYRQPVAAGGQRNCRGTKTLKTDSRLPGRENFAGLGERPLLLVKSVARALAKCLAKPKW